jgi:diguanylate cyclase (GGDEF)-like protein
MGLNIRQKILLAFLLVILVSGAAVFLIYNNSSRITELTSKIYNEDLNIIDSIQQMRHHLLLSDWALSKYLLKPSISWRNEVHSSYRQFTTQFNRVKYLLVHDRDKTLMANIKKLSQQYSRQIDTQLTRFDLGLLDSKQQQEIRDQESVVLDVIVLLEKLVENTYGRLGERLNEARALKEMNRKLSVGVILVVAFTSALLVFILNQNIILPIHRLMEGVRKFAGGNFTAQVPVTSQDEIGELSGTFNDMVRKIRTDRQALTALTTIDEKTGLFNFRHFKQAVNEEIKRAERYNRHMSLVMIDIDHFKHYNDTNGHPMGDLLLKELSLILKESIRETDMVARFGGEEFILLLPETPPREALKLAESLRLRIKNHVFPMEEKQPNKDLTVSMGVASYPSRNVVSPDTLLERADKALYKAKKQGRNRVCV